MLAVVRARYGNPMNERTLAGRIAFWLLLPSLFAMAIAIGLLADVSGHAPGARMLSGPLLFLAVIVLFVLLSSMTFQTLLIVRRPQTLTVRSLPTRIALLQFMLYGVVALWVTLLATIVVPLLLSLLLFAAIVTLPVMLLTRIQGWPRGELAAMPRVRLSVPVRVALWGYSALAVGALGYVVAAIANPVLDGDGIRSVTVLLALGLPLSLVALPVALFGALVVPGIGFSLIVIALLVIVLNVVVVQLVLWSPTRRVTLVNWFFRFNDEEPATSVAGSSI